MRIIFQIRYIARKEMRQEREEVILKNISNKIRANPLDQFYPCSKKRTLIGRLRQISFASKTSPSTR
jgi:hypothetical protein